MDNRQAFVMMDLFHIDDLGTAKPLQIRDVSIADLLELEYHASKYDTNNFNKSKWVKVAIKHFNTHMKMVEEMENKDPLHFFLSQLSMLIQTKPQNKERILKELQEFIDNNGNK